jgi:hypothetical protein
MSGMKATIEIPDELYRQLKAKSALEGRAIREVATELFTDYVEGRRGGDVARELALRDAFTAGERQPPAWFGLARPYLRDVASHDWRAVRESIDRGWTAADEVAEPAPAKATRTRRR